MAIPLVVLSALCLVVAITVLIIGIVAVREHRGWGITAIAVGALLVIAPVGGIVWSLTWGSTQPHVWVQGLNPQTDPGLQINIRNNTFVDEGDRVSFVVDMSTDEVLATVEQQHPGGQVGGNSLWHLTEDDIRYDLFKDRTEGIYSLDTQVAVVTPRAGGTRERIAFPSSALNTRGLWEGTPFPTYWSTQDWADFYRDMEQAVITLDSVTVPTNRGNTATIYFSDGQAIVELNGQ